MSRRKRLAVVFIAVIAVSIILTLTVSAADDGVGSGFSLWNLLDGLGGFFRDLINSIGGFFKNVISAIRYGFNSMIDWFASVVRAIGNAITALLNGIKNLFIPSKESFFKFRDDIITKFDKKFGSVFFALDSLNKRFKFMNPRNNLDNIFKVTFYGISVDLLNTAKSVLLFIRGCLTAICSLVTALTCYHKIISMVNK